MYGDSMYGGPAPSMYGDYGGYGGQMGPAGVQVQPVGGGDDEWSRAPVGGNFVNANLLCSLFLIELRRTSTTRAAR